MEAAKINPEQITIEEDEFPVAEALEQMYKIFSLQAVNLRKPVEIQLNIPRGGNFAHIWTDKQRFRKILLNLMENALKSTQAGIIELGFSITEDEKYRFYISRSGTGISNEMQKEVFNRHWELSTAKDLAETIGGSINLEFIPGKGSTFSLVLPEHLDEIHVGKNARIPVLVN